MKNYIPCIVCGKKATWSYMPSKGDYCDAHVPRGCSCNADESGVEELDEQGRKQPCCEYHQISESWHNDPETVWNGWENYYEEHPEYRSIEEYEEPPIRKRTRRTRLIEQMPDRKQERNQMSHHKEHISKPKGWKHRK